jgi:hypothetical protein
MRNVARADRGVLPDFTGSGSATFAIRVIANYGWLPGDGLLNRKVNVYIIYLRL